MKNSYIQFKCNEQKMFRRDPNTKFYKQIKRKQKN